MFPMASVILTLALLPFTLSAPTATVCNGHTEYCSRIYSNVSQIGSHDSAFIGNLPTQNQHLSLSDQLSAGVRFLQGQTHKNDGGTLELCHTSCFEEDGGSAQDYLSTVKSFLDANPNEVLTVLLTNGDNVDVSMFDDAISGSGIKDYAFVPATGSGVLGINDWPTLSDMIGSGQRLVFFLGRLPSVPPLNEPLTWYADTGADTGRFPYILDEFSYFFETPFDVTDATFSNCSLDRPAGASPSGRMYIVNHFLDVDIFGILVPDEEKAPQTNAASGSGSIGAQATLCEGIYQQAPKGVLLDYMDLGDPFTAEKALNGVS